MGFRTDSLDKTFPEKPAQSGDIILCRWPPEQNRHETIANFALVLGHAFAPNGVALTILAYMTSMTPGLRSPNGFSITKSAHIRDANLGSPSRVDLERIQILPWTQYHILPHRNGYIVGQLAKPLAVEADGSLARLIQHSTPSPAHLLVALNQLRSRYRLPAT